MSKAGRIAGISLMLGLQGIAATSANAAAPPRNHAMAGLAADNVLVLFSSATPQNARSVKLTGISEAVIGIDMRPLDGKLYGITASDKLVTIDPRSGATAMVSTLGTPFRAGEAIGFDFNPQADRLRLTGTAGQNLRIQVVVGAVAVDGTLAYAPGDANAGKQPHIVAVAYSNSYANAPSTVTFTIDSGLDILVRQEPPNEGVLRTIGPLGINCGEAAGFDIASPQPGIDDAFAICGQTLYRIDLVTGLAKSIAPIGATAPRYLGLAVLGAPPR